MEVQLDVLCLMPVDPVLLQAYVDVSQLSQRLLQPLDLPVPGRPSRIGRGLPVEQLILQVACFSPTWRKLCHGSTDALDSFANLQCPCEHLLHLIQDVCIKRYDTAKYLLNGMLITEYHVC